MRSLLHMMIAGVLLVSVASLAGCDAYVEDSAASDRPQHTGTSQGHGRQSALGGARDAADRIEDRAGERDQKMQEMMDEMFDN